MSNIIIENKKSNLDLDEKLRISQIIMDSIIKEIMLGGKPQSLLNKEKKS